MSPRTLFLSRLLGLYLFVCGLALIVHKEAFRDALATLPNNSLTILWASFFTVLAGLAMVLVHNIWSKSPVAVIVTVLGWLTLIKGVLYLLLPLNWLEKFIQGAFNSSLYLYSVTVVSLLLGAYLTYEGFRSGTGSGATSISSRMPAAANR